MNRSFHPGVLFTAVISLFLMAGCATPEVQTLTTPAGSRVTISTELIARSSDRVYVQNGEAVTRRRISKGLPHCIFDVERQSGQQESLTIDPDTFIVTGTSRERERLLTGMKLSTIMTLSSDTQPEVVRMICRRHGSLAIDGFVTIAEMKNTLSPLVELVMPE